MSHGNACADKLARAGALIRLSEDIPCFAEDLIHRPSYNPKPWTARPSKKGKAKGTTRLTWHGRDDELRKWKERKKTSSAAEPCLAGSKREPMQNGWTALYVP